MPVVKRLRDARAAKLWPFETGWKPLTPADLAGVEAVFAEIYPEPLRRQGGPLARSRTRRKCAPLANASTRWTKRANSRRCSARRRTTPRREVVEREEGWILGAPF